MEEYVMKKTDEELMNEATLVKVRVDDLDGAVKFLKEAKEAGSNVKIEFRKKTLYSMLDDEDSCFIKVFGKTKAEHEEELAKELAEEDLRDQKRKAEVQAKVPQWKERGHKLVYPEQEKEWDRCVDIRVSDLYNANELEYALQVMEALDAGKSVEEAIEIAEKYDYSGASWGVMKSVVTNFSKRGPEFYRATLKQLDGRENHYIENLVERNKLLEQGYSLADIQRMKEAHIEEINSIVDDYWKFDINNTTQLTSDIYNVINPQKMQDWKNYVEAQDIKDLFGSVGIRQAYVCLALLKDKLLTEKDVMSYMKSNVDAMAEVCGVLNDMVKFGDENAIGFVKDNFSGRVSKSLLDSCSPKKEETFGDKD